MYMKKLFFVILLAAMSVAGFAQRLDFVDVGNLPDGRYSDDTSDVKITGWVLNGQKTGTWIECHSNSELPHFIRQYANGKLDGVCIDIDKQGIITKQAEYNNGEFDGQVIRWQRGGMMRDIVSYKNGLKDGPSKICYDKGTVQEESNYKEGQRDGITIWYAYNDKAQGPKVAMYTYKDGKFEGVQETYYEDGTVKTRKMFEDNVQHGLSVEFYEDGSIKSETNYKKGEISGKIKEYDKGVKMQK